VTSVSETHIDMSFHQAAVNVTDCYLFWCLFILMNYILS